MIKKGGGVIKIVRNVHNENLRLTIIQIGKIEKKIL